MISVGEQIREARKQKGLTQEQLAEKVDRNLRTIQRVENGENIPSKNTLDLICEVLLIELVEESEVQKNENYELRKVGNFIAQGIFLLILNIALLSLVGYLTINHEANTPSRVAAHLLSFLIPFFIVLFTRKMTGIERMLKFGFGYLFYLTVVIIMHPILHLFIKGFYTTQIISLGVLFYGNEIMNLLKIGNET